MTLFLLKTVSVANQLRGFPHRLHLPVVRRTAHTNLLVSLLNIVIETFAENKN